MTELKSLSYLQKDDIKLTNYNNAYIEFRKCIYNYEEKKKKNIELPFKLLSKNDSSKDKVIRLFNKPHKVILPCIFKIIYYSIFPLIIINILTLMVANMMPTKYISSSGVNIATTLFITNIFIFGIVGVIWTFIIKLFNKNTYIRQVFAFSYTIFLGIYFINFFDGYNPNETLGNYYVGGSQLQAVIGLQIISIFLLITTAFKGIYHIIKIFEVQKIKISTKQRYKIFNKIKPDKLKPVLKKNRKNYKEKRKRRLCHSNIIKTISLLLTLCFGIYAFTLIESGFNISIDIPETYSFSWSVQDDDIDHDGLIISVDFDLANMGIYPATDVLIEADVYIKTSSDNTLLPLGGKVAEAENIRLDDFQAFTLTNPGNIKANIGSQFLIGLFLEDCKLEIIISIQSEYGGIKLDLDTVVYWDWINLLDSIDLFNLFDGSLGDYSIYDYIEIIRSIGINNLLEFVTLDYLFERLGEDGISLLLDYLGLPGFLVFFTIDSVFELINIIPWVFDILLGGGFF